MLVLALFAFRFVYYSSLLFSYSGGDPLQAMVSHVRDSWFLLGLANRKTRQEISGRQWRRRQGISHPSFPPPALLPSSTHLLFHSSPPVPSLGDSSFPKPDAAVPLDTSVHYWLKTPTCQVSTHNSDSVGIGSPWNIVMWTAGPPFGDT